MSNEKNENENENSAFIPTLIYMAYVGEISSNINEIRLW